MANNEIIIDGVDVSGCEFFLKEHPQNCQKNYGGACSYLPNCYYKQLKRKEQECEELKDKLRTKARGWANVNDQILKEVDQLKADNKHLNGLLDQALKELEEHRDALEKIKEICTKYKEICANCEGDGYIDCVDCTEGGEAQAAIKVLQICDEVNDER